MDLCVPGSRPWLLSRTVLALPTAAADAETDVGPLSVVETDVGVWLEREEIAVDSVFGMYRC